MKNIFKNALVTYGPRLLGVAAGFVSAKLAEQHITIDPAALIAIGTFVYGIVHKTASSVVTPTT